MTFDDMLRHIVLWRRNPELMSVVFGVKDIRNYGGVRYTNLTIYLHKYDPYA